MDDYVYLVDDNHAWSAFIACHYVPDQVVNESSITSKTRILIVRSSDYNLFSLLFHSILLSKPLDERSESTLFLILDHYRWLDLGDTLLYSGCG